MRIPMVLIVLGFWATKAFSEGASSLPLKEVLPDEKNVAPAAGSSGRESAGTTLDDKLVRVSQRDPMTHAILAVDQHNDFRLEIEGEQARITIWKPMKIADPNQETHTFPITEVLRQEHVRLQFQEELSRLAARCVDSERQFRISQYKKHPLRAGMPYAEALELLKEEFKSDGLPRAEAGASGLVSDSHFIKFRHGVLVDIITKETADKPGAGGGK
jgi:hypothetical protein